MQSQEVLGGDCVIIPAYSLPGTRGYTRSHTAQEDSEHGHMSRFEDSVETGRDTRMHGFMYIDPAGLEGA